MDQPITVTATEANRSFSKLLREVDRGKRVVITSHGRKVAVMEPVEKPRLTREERLAAVEEMKRHWATQKHITIGPWTREELYERD
jgi:prevent-host-death family protein